MNTTTSNNNHVSFSIDLRGNNTLIVGAKRFAVGDFLQRWDSLTGWETYRLTYLSTGKYGAQLDKVGADGKASNIWGAWTMTVPELADMLGNDNLPSVVLYSDVVELRKKELTDEVNACKVQDAQKWAKAEEFMHFVNQSEQCHYSEELMQCEAIKIFAGQTGAKISYIKACTLADFFTFTDKLHRVNK